MTLPLLGCTVVVTRERRGELGRLLDEAGARVVHVPLIEVVDGDLDGLGTAWSTSPDWLIVTSPAGAERAVPGVLAHPATKLAAVGTATAGRIEELIGRSVDLVPERQLAGALVDRFVERNREPSRVLVAQADRAAPTLADGLRAAGHDVTVVTVYRTLTRALEPADLWRLAGADAVIFASGSAARAWTASLGDRALDALPSLAVAIGPTTAAEAVDAGLRVTHTAGDHSLVGVVDELIRAWSAG